MDVRTIFGLLTVLVVTLAIASHHAQSIKQAFLLLGVWVLSNLVVELMGYTEAPRVLPAVSGCIAAAMALVARIGRNKVSLALCGLFLCIAFTHLLAFIEEWQGSRYYYVVLNVVYGIMLFMVGVSSVKEGVARWASRRRFGAVHSPAHRVGVVAGGPEWTIQS